MADINFYYGAKISYLIAGVDCVIHYELSRHYLIVITVTVTYPSVQDIQSYDQAKSRHLFKSHDCNKTL